MIGDRLKELRKLLSMTQKDLAEHLGLKSQTTIAAIETNKNRPSNELLSRMADLFMVSTDFLLGKIEQDMGYIRLIISFKLKKHMKEEHITLEELSEKLNLPLNHLRAIENAESDPDILISYEALAKYMKLSLYENNSPISNAYNHLKLQASGKNISALGASIDPLNISSKDFINVPIVGEVRAGMPILAIENIEGYILLPRDMFKSNKEYFALKVKGDSMNLEFNEGSTIIVEKTNLVENGKIGVVLVDSCEATVKKVVQHNNMITLIPMSTNSKHTPSMYNLEKDDVRIIGKVRYAIKEY